MNFFVNDVLERTIAQASLLANYNKRYTISSREIQMAVRVIPSGGLAKYVASEDTTSMDTLEVLATTVTQIVESNYTSNLLRCNND
ncbi:unnamed protein product [Onchocerca ochengi]|uniref:Histone domain-containing protein n=1 Tax=Onchocerca ochengi TaxID=42157 RepID=A0A182E1Y7_ONCOC|nr:unnamed protein product [Onchocerca ochengi]